MSSSKSTTAASSLEETGGASTEGFASSLASSSSSGLDLWARLIRPPLLVGSGSAGQSFCFEALARCFFATFTVTSSSSSILFLLPPTGSVARALLVTLLLVMASKQKQASDVENRQFLAVFVLISVQSDRPEAARCCWWSLRLLRKPAMNISKGNGGLELRTSSVRSWRTLSDNSDLRPDPFKKKMLDSVFNPLWHTSILLLWIHTTVKRTGSSSETSSPSTFRETRLLSLEPTGSYEPLCVGSVLTQREPQTDGSGLEVCHQTSCRWHSDDDWGHSRLQRGQSVKTQAKPVFR